VYHLRWPTKERRTHEERRSRYSPEEIRVRRKKREKDQNLPCPWRPGEPLAKKEKKRTGADQLLRRTRRVVRRT